MFAWQATVQDDAGNAIPLPVVTVYLDDGVTLASIYTESGSNLPNPMTGTLEGFVQFWVEAGRYKVEGASGGDQTEVWSVGMSASDIIIDTSGLTVQERLDEIPNDNLSATSRPTAGDDSGDGYSVGSRWVTPSAEFHNLSAVTSAAVWKPLDLSSIDPEHFGPMGQGQDAQIIQAAIDFCNARGGGVVNARNRSFTLGQTLVAKSGVEIDLRGGYFRLASGLHISHIMSDGFASLVGGSSDDGPVGFKLTGGELVGNYTVNTAPAAGEYDGIGIAFYGRMLEVDGTKFRSLRGSGIWGEFAGNQSPYGHKYKNILIENVGRSGWVHNVSDAHAAMINIRSVARAGEPECDGLKLLRFLRGDLINVWQPGSGGNTDNMRYACGALGVAAYITNGTFEHGRDASLYVDPNCINASFIACNIHTVRGAGSPVALIRSRNGHYDLTCYNGSIQPNSALLQLGIAGDSNTYGNMINITARSQQASNPVAVVDIVSSGGNNIINIGGDIASTSGTPQQPVRGTPAVSDRITQAVQASPYMAPISANRRVQSTSSAAVGVTLPMPNASTWVAEGTVTGRQISGNGRYGAKVSFMVGRGNGVSTVGITGTPTVTVIGQNQATGWSVSVVADTTDGGPRIVMVGADGATVEWSVDLRINEVR